MSTLQLYIIPVVEVYRARQPDEPPMNVLYQCNACATFFSSVGSSCCLPLETCAFRSAECSMASPLAAANIVPPGAAHPAILPITPPVSRMEAPTHASAFQPSPLLPEAPRYGPVQSMPPPTASPPLMATPTPGKVGAYAATPAVLPSYSCYVAPHDFGYPGSPFAYPGFHVAPTPGQYAAPPTYLPYYTPYQSSPDYTGFPTHGQYGYAAQPWAPPLPQSHYGIVH